MSTSLNITPLKCWPEAKKLRSVMYEEYVEAGKKGGIRWSGSAWAFSSIPSGLGDDVYYLAGEPYGATCGSIPEISRDLLLTAQAAGYARDICSYALNYFGCIIQNKFILPVGRAVEWQLPDFAWTIHTCCQHAKWYQVAADLEYKVYGQKIPLFAVDIPIGLRTDPPEIKKKRIEYVVTQLKEGIEWLEKVTGRNYNESRLIDAVKTEIMVTHTWARICELNQASPAPMDERAIYSLFAFGPMYKHDKRTLEFYQKLLKEVEERVEKGIGMFNNERARVVSNSNPPWFATYIWRRLEQRGCIPVGSLYTYSLIGCWDVEDGKLVPKELPWKKGYNINSMEDALWIIAEWTLYGRLMWQVAHDLNAYIDYIDMLAKQWKADAIILHYNKGCEYFAFGIPEVKRQLSKRGFRVYYYEGSTSNPYDVNIDEIYARFDAIADSLGL